MTQAPEHLKADVGEAESEAALLAALKAGDEGAFERLVRENTPRMLAVARRFFSTESDAEDAVQEAFLSAFKALDRFEGGSKLSTWLHRITVNASLMKLRARKSRPEKSIEEMLPAFSSDGQRHDHKRGWRRTPEQLLSDNETAKIVRAKIDELPADYREVLLLRDIEELDTAAAAEVLGISREAVKTRLHRARQALRHLLADVLKDQTA